MNRLDQLQNFTVQINHRVRSLEVNSATDPAEFMWEMSVLYNDKIAVLQRYSTVDVTISYLPQSGRESSEAVTSQINQLSDSY